MNFEEFIDYLIEMAKHNISVSQIALANEISQYKTLKPLLVVRPFAYMIKFNNEMGLVNALPVTIIHEDKTCMILLSPPDETEQVKIIGVSNDVGVGDIKVKNIDYIKSNFITENDATKNTSSIMETILNNL